MRTAPGSSSVLRVTRRRGTFGLDERRRRDPARVEAELRDRLKLLLPEVWVLPEVDDADPSGRSLALVLPQGRVAMLRIERRRDEPGRAALALLDRCRAMRIPAALVSDLDDALAALRRIGLGPLPAAPSNSHGLEMARHCDQGEKGIAPSVRTRETMSETGGPAAPATSNCPRSRS